MAEKMARKIDGKKLAEEILLDLYKKVRKMVPRPGLAAILIGDDPASKLYVANKKKACIKVGINFYDYYCAGKDHPADTEKDILDAINFLNKDPQVNGIIVQLPVPKKFNTEKIINSIDPQKDVDGFHPQNKKKFLGEKYIITPPLIQAVNQALCATKQNLKNKQAVIVAKGPIFSEPMRKDLKQQGLKVKIVKPDQNLSSQTKKADILIVVVGQKHLIKKEMVKEGAIVIDIGTNLVDEKTWAGDVDPEAAEVAAWLTPVPGGIGPLTVAMLLKSCYELSISK